MLTRASHVLARPDIERAAGNVTSLMDLAYAAMATLALIIAGVTTAHAAAPISDGRVHYEPACYRLPDVHRHARTRVA